MPTTPRVTFHHAVSLYAMLCHDDVWCGVVWCGVASRCVAYSAVAHALKCVASFPRVT